MKGIHRILAVAIVLCLLAGPMPEAARAAQGGMSAEQLQEVRQRVAEGRISELVQKDSTTEDGIVIPYAVTQTAMFKEGRLPVIVKVSAQSVAQYAKARQKSLAALTSTEKAAAEAAIDNAQQLVINQAVGRGMGLQDVERFGLLLAGFSANIPTNMLGNLVSLVGRSNVYVQRLYKLEDAFSNSMIAANPGAWTDPGVDGTGAVVGVVDTGVDYTHPDLGGGTWGPGTAKIQGYDFAGDNAAALDDPALLTEDDNPMDSNGHGTHVSGIIAADGAELKGVAPKARLVVAKIVPGGEGSAWSSSIIAAFEYMADATGGGDSAKAHWPVTAVNMSFGSDSGFVDSTDPEKIAIEGCISSGIVVSLSAGNAGAGDSTYPDYATIGSPSITPGSLSVASVENTDATNWTLHESATDADYPYLPGSTSPYIYGTLTGSYHYIYCGYGADSTYFPSSAPANTIALIWRGLASFGQKVHNAAAAGFEGAIIYNNTTGTISMLTTGATLPSMSVTQADGLTLKAQIAGIVEASYKPSTWPLSTGVITFGAPMVGVNPLANKVSDFSSWGPPPDLSFKPDLTAPGGNIWSTVPVAMGMYANYSGTSMAAPHVAAAAALVRRANPTWTVTQTKLALSNTARLLDDPNSGDGSYYSPRLVGAGLINVQNAAKTSVLAKRTGFDTASVALGSIEDWNTNPISFGLTLENLGASTVTYTTSGTVQWTRRDTLEALAVPGATISMSPSTVVVPAGQTRNVTVTVDATHVALTYNSHPFAEGYVRFTPTSGSTINLHVPYTAYLGNWNDFNRGDEQFNPIVEPQSVAEGSDWLDVYNTNTWLYNLDVWEHGGLGASTHQLLLPMGTTFDGTVYASAVAINPHSTGFPIVFDGYFYKATYGTIAGLNILRNLDHLSITVENGSGTVVRHIADIGLETLPLMGKGLWIGDEVYWDWKGVDDSSAIVPDGQYYFVARMTPQKVVNKLVNDADQVIRMPISVDTVDPVVTIASIVPATTTQTVSWTTTDAAPSSGIFGCELYWSMDDWAHYSYALLPPTATSYSGVPRGAEVDLYVVDYAGNWGNDYETPQDVVITSTLPETVVIGTQTPFAIHTQNWGVETFEPVRHDGTITAPLTWQPADILLECLDGSWQVVPLTGSNGSFAFSLPPHAGFTLQGGWNSTPNLRVTVTAGSAPGHVSFNVNLDTLDGSENPVGDPVASLTDATWAITALLDITSAPSPLLDGYTNTAYVGAIFSATGGVGAPYTFTATGLPVGMTVSSAGVLSGTPTATSDFTLHVTVANADGALAHSEDFALHINQGPGVTISWQPLAGGTVSGPTVPPEDSTGVYAVHAKSGYTIGQVLWNGASQALPAGATDHDFPFTHITGSNTLAVTFNPIVTVTAGAHGTITPGTGPVTYHSSPAYAVMPNLGYLIDTLTLDGVVVKDASNTLAYTVTLPMIEAPHTIAATFKSIPDVLAPTITLPKFGSVAGVTNWTDGPVQTFTVGTSPFPLSFTLEDNSGAAKWSVSVNGAVIVDPMGSGLITYPVPLSEGRNDVVIIAVDATGNQTTQRLIIYLDSMGPAIVLGPTPASVSSPVLTIAGTVMDAVSGLRSLTIDGTPVVPFLDGSFSEKLTLKKGDNAVVIEAVDKVGHVTSQTVTVKYGVTSPVVPSSIYAVLTIGSADMEVNGLTHKLDAAPFIKDGRTLLPIRALIEALGGSVQWNPFMKTATVLLGSRTVVLTIGSKTALVGGKPVALDVAPMIVKGRTFLPLRAVAENVGLDLAWEPVSKTVSLTYWP
jgi:subtilisin family serine protease